MYFSPCISFPLHGNYYLPYEHDTVQEEVHEQSSPLDLVIKRVTQIILKPLSTVRPRGGSQGGGIHQ